MTRPIPLAKCILLAALGLAASTAWSQRPGPGPGPAIAPPPPATAAQPADNQPAPIIRTYNVADLVRTSPDYPFRSAALPPTQFGQEIPAVATSQIPGGPPAPPPANNAGIAIQQLCQVITSTVDPGNWREQGGSLGSIQPLGSLLIVTQTDENQRKVQNLLDMIRTEYGPLKTVGVHAHWVLLQPSMAAEILPGHTPGAVTPLSAETLAKLPPESRWAEATTACFSGQTVYVSSGRIHTVVTKLEPVVGTQAAAYNTTTQLVQAGAVLQVTPLLSGDGKTAVLDLASVATDWTALENPIDVYDTTQLRGESPTTRPIGHLDRLNTPVQQMRTTLRLPVNTPVLLGGMTFTPGSDNQSQTLYLIAEVTVAQ